MAGYLSAVLCWIAKRSLSRVCVCESQTLVLSGVGPDSGDMTSESSEAPCT